MFKEDIKAKLPSEYHFYYDCVTMPKYKWKNADGTMDMHTMKLGHLDHLFKVILVNWREELDKALRFGRYDLFPEIKDACLEYQRAIERKRNECLQAAYYLAKEYDDKKPQNIKAEKVTLKFFGLISPWLNKQPDRY